MIGAFLFDLEAAIGGKTPFPLAWKRVRHIRYGHPFGQSKLIEKHRFLQHPQNDHVLTFTVNLMKCNDCGLCWLDEGFEGEIPCD